MAISSYRVSLSISEGLEKDILEGYHHYGKSLNEILLSYLGEKDLDLYYVYKEGYLLELELDVSNPSYETRDVIIDTLEEMGFVVRGVQRTS